MTFEEFRLANKERCVTAFKMSLDDWSLAEWSCALFGEAGEMCNEVKKVFRGDGNIENVTKEIADIVTYADLFCSALGVKLEDILKSKFNEVSEKKNSNIRI